MDVKREYGSDAVTRGRDPGESMFWGLRVEIALWQKKAYRA